MEKNYIFNIQKFSLHDGPGIRTLIFFKGCSLHCLWCANPEGISSQFELMKKDSCLECGKCHNVCPARLQQNCLGCKACLEICPTHCRTIVGKNYTSKELMDIILQDKVFYLHSGGGVTLTGGEPLLHFPLVLDLLKEATNEKIHTAVESCGHVPWKNWEEALPYLNLIFFDLKQMDSQKHQKLTGAPNTLILENLTKLLSYSPTLESTTVPVPAPDIFLRIPLIQGLNDAREDWFPLIKLLQIHDPYQQKIKEIHLLPYHNLGEAKYLALGKDYPLKAKYGNENYYPTLETLKDIDALFQESHYKTVLYQYN